MRVSANGQRFMGKEKITKEEEEEEEGSNGRKVKNENKKIE